MSTVLLLVQDFCGKMSLPIPAALMTSTETTMVQMRSLCQEVLRSLRKFEWQRQRLRVTWTSVATESQGVLDSAGLFTSAYRRLVPGTMWNVSLNRPIFGPIGSANWQMLKSAVPTGPVETYRIEGNELKILPVMQAGQTCSAMVLTSYGCVASDTTTYKERFTADDDTPLFPDEVFITDLEWRWLKQKGEPWTAAYEQAYSELCSNLNKDGHMPVVDLGSPRPQVEHGLVIPAGNWNV